jgi:carboxyl-terminal processing protease
VGRRKSFIAILTLTAVFFVGYSLGLRNFHPELQNGRIVFQNQNPPRDQIVNFQLFWDVYDTIQKNYYDKSKINGDKLLTGAIQGMVGSLGDPYTAFLSSQQNKDVTDQLSGTYEGVGIQLGYRDNFLVAIAPLDGTPAKEAGVRAGDRILKIGDKATDSMALPEAVALIRGSAGTKISMTLLHEGSQEPYSVTLTRATIKVKSVEFTDKGGGVGYIKLSRFGDTTNDEWDAAVSAALSAGSRVIVLDVRDNPGGFLQSAVYIGSEFVASGPIVKQDTAGNVKELNVMRTGKLLQMPIVVMINKGSASASEIVSGALQDYARATLVGDQSFGKGTVQEVDDVKCTKSQAVSVCPSLHITTARWLTPKGRWINGTGLTPDVKVALSDADIKAGRDPQLDRALEIAKSKIK